MTNIVDFKSYLEQNKINIALNESEESTSKSDSSSSTRYYIKGFSHVASSNDKRERIEELAKKSEQIRHTINSLSVCYTSNCIFKGVDDTKTADNPKNIPLVLPLQDSLGHIYKEKLAQYNGIKTKNSSPEAKKILAMTSVNQDNYKHVGKHEFKYLKDYIKNVQEDINSNITIDEAFEGLLNRLKTSNELVNGESPYNARSILNTLKKAKQDIYNIDGTFFENMKGDFERRGEEFINRNKQSVTGFLDKANAEINKYKQYSEFITTSDSIYIGRIQSYITAAFGNLSGIIISLNNLLDKYKSSWNTINSNADITNLLKDKANSFNTEIAVAKASEIHDNKEIRTANFNKVKEKARGIWANAKDTATIAGVNLKTAAGETGANLKTAANAVGKEAKEKFADIKTKSSVKRQEAKIKKESDKETKEKFVQDFITLYKNNTTNDVIKQISDLKDEKEINDDDNKIKALYSLFKFYANPEQQEKVNKSEYKTAELKKIAKKYWDKVKDEDSGVLLKNKDVSNDKLKKVKNLANNIFGNKEQEKPAENNATDADVKNAAKDFDNEQEEPKTIFDYALTKAKRNIK